MVKRHYKECHSAYADSHTPRIGYVARTFLHQTGYGDQYSLTENHRDTIKRAAYAHKTRLTARTMCQHIEAVGSNVMRGRSKGRQDEEYQCEGENAYGRRTGSHGLCLRARQCQKEQAHAGGHKHLHNDYPPAFGANRVHQRCPQPLQEPWEIEQRGEKSHAVIGDAHLGEHHHRDVIDQEIRNTLGKIQCGNPYPRRS